MLAFFRTSTPIFIWTKPRTPPKIQFKIIELLTGKIGNLFMVGDEDQSIYGFRGAFPQSLLAFKETRLRAKCC